MPAEVDDQARAERFAGHAGAGPARAQRHLVLRRIADQRLHVLLVARHDHAQRPDLEDAGVGAVQGTRQVVEEEFPLDDPLEVVADVLALLFVHGMGNGEG